MTFCNKNANAATNPILICRIEMKGSGKLTMDLDLETKTVAMGVINQEFVKEAREFRTEMKTSNSRC